LRWQDAEFLDALELRQLAVERLDDRGQAGRRSCTNGR
jgi:hypothetical protein